MAYDATWQHLKVLKIGQKGQRIMMSNEDSSVHVKNGRALPQFEF
jgi:hypothetical protein